MSEKNAKNAGTDTNRQNNQAENLAKAVQLLQDVSQLLADNIELSGEGSASDLIVARLSKRKADDVILVCDIRVVSRNGEIARAYGENMLPSALAPHMLGQAHEGFANMLQATVVDPLVTSFQNHLAELAMESSPYEEMGGYKKILSNEEDPLLTT
jgi:hypothetical protein